MRTLGTIFAGLLGLAFGSFLNVCLSRWPAGESVVHPRSHCRQCGRALAWWENIPLISWLALRGRCRSCRSWIGWRYPLVELAVAALWAFFAWRSYNALFPLEFACGMMLFLWTIVALALLDAEHLWLPDALTLPMIAMGFLWRFFQEVQAGWVLKIQPTPWDQAKDAISLLLGILAAAALILLIRWLYWLVRRREGLGLGDVKLMAMLAAWLGLPGALLAFSLGVVLGSLVALVLLLIPAARSKSQTIALTKLPLGAFLCIGGIASSLWGERLIDFYLRWAGF